MTETKEIPLADVKVGMRVRITHSWRGIVKTSEAAVASVRDHRLSLGADGSREIFGPDDIDKIELITPPVPTFETGDRFQDRDGDCWVVMDDPGRATLHSDKRADLGITNSVAFLAQYYGPLTPIPEHGDGCSPWLWDPVTKSVWVEVSIEDSTVTHRQVRGRWVVGGDLRSGRVPGDAAIARRLIPWSERDHG